MPNMATGKINTNFPSGLWESKYVKWLKVKKIDWCNIDIGGPCLKIRYLCKKECNRVKEEKDWKLYGHAGKDRGRGYKITCTDDDGVPTLLENKYSITRCDCSYGSYVGKIKDGFIFLEAKQLCNWHSAAEGSTKMSFEWLD